MTDHQHCTLSKREFEVIAFRVHQGKIIRSDRQTHIYSVTDNVPGLLIRAARSHVAQGRSVLVLEFGTIKPDYCRLTDLSRKALLAMNREDARQLLRNVEVMSGVSYDDFIAHVRRSFPE